jgi:type IV secretion system protein VirB10
MLSKNMSIAPTIEIRPGYRFNVMLVKDLEFKRPYRAFDYIQE